MSYRDQVTRFATVVLVFCTLGAALTVNTLDSLRPQASLEEVLYIRSPKALKFMSLGYTGLAASIYWTRAVQYFGGKHVDKAVRYDLLKPLLEITTELDPHLLIAYEFGSMFLSQPPPQGAGQPDAAVELIQRGIAKNPGNWRLYYYLGFVHYTERKDYIAAAQAFEQGSVIPGAHPWLRTMAAAARQRGGDIQVAQYLWSQIYQSSEDKMVKDTAMTRLVALRVDSDIMHLEAMVDEFRKRNGYNPSSWEQFIASGLIGGTPADPTGAAYKLMPGGRIEVQNPKKLPFITKGLPPGEAPLEYNPNAGAPRSTE